MAEQSRLVVVCGRKRQPGVVHVLQAASEVREATTGRVVVIPRVCATAEVRSSGLRLHKGAHTQEAVSYAKAAPVPDEELGFYRKYTERLLQRYLQMTMEAGRVSSLMGREVIGGRTSHYRIHGFDDAVIFRLDVEKCLRQLSPKEQDVIRRVAIQEYTQAEAAELMGVSLRTVVSRYGRALDRLTGILLRTRLLDPLRACQAVSSMRRS